MKNEAMRDRTKRFALRVIRLFGALPHTTDAQTIGKQLIRSGTSVAANYREASRARSDAELKSKLGIVEQELDESLLWMELLVESGIVDEAKLIDLMQETNELLAMTVTAIRTIKSRE
jgi:four helix bundle protein